MRLHFKVTGYSPRMLSELSVILINSVYHPKDQKIIVFHIEEGIGGTEETGKKEMCVRVAVDTLFQRDEFFTY